jgi:16S rRNA (guanine1207-N2)-methyltransferase
VEAPSPSVSLASPNGTESGSLAGVNPALDTLMLAFAPDGLPIPGRALFLGAEPHPELRSWPSVVGWQPSKPNATAWEAAGHTRIDEPDGKWPLVMVVPGKSRDETLWWLSVARDHLEPGGTIVVSMPNTAGASRFEKELKTASGKLFSIQKHKCRTFYATDDGTWNEDIFSNWRLLGGKRKIEGSSFVTEAGIFSSEHIDPGSLLLASHLPASLRGKAADLGAGWGYLTDALLKRCPKISSVDLYEADSRALACAESNLLRYQRGIGPKEDPLSLESPACMVTDEIPLTFHWHDVTKGLPEKYDVIIMNPPFHSGQATDVDLGRSFLRTAAASLNRGGKLLLVANRQLPYEAELTALGMPARKLAEDNVYKILSAERR